MSGGKEILNDAQDAGARFIGGFLPGGSRDKPECPECGAKLDSDDAECPECGAELD